MALSSASKDVQGCDRVLSVGGVGHGVVGTSLIVAYPNTDPVARLMHSLSHPHSQLSVKVRFVQNGAMS